MISTQKKPRGRPPADAFLNDQGRWELCPAALEKHAARLEKHRTDCRMRYRNNRDALKLQRPDLFKKKIKDWNINFHFFFLLFNKL